VLYVVYVLAAIGGLFLLALFLRLSGFKGFYFGCEFHKPNELKDPSEVHLANGSQTSRSLLRNGSVSDSKRLE
jgi:hypothetical protein